VLIKVGQKTNNYLKKFSNQLKRNHNQMEKIEIAVRRSYSHQNVRPVYNHNRYIPNFRTFPKVGGADPVLCHCQAEEWEYQEAQVLE
jgi:hypothetical protein